MLIDCIKIQIDHHLDEIKHSKKEFLDSVKNNKPSFEKYLIFFRIFQRIINNLRFPNITKNRKLVIYFAQENSVVYLFAKIFLTKERNFNSLEYVTDEEVYTNYYSRFLTYNLHLISSKQITFLNIISEMKFKRWFCRKEGNEKIISRYTPDTVTISTTDTVDYSYDFSGTVTTYNNNGYTGLVFNPGSGSITFSSIPEGTIFNLLIVGGGGSGTIGGFYNYDNNQYFSGGGGGGITYIENINITNIEYNILVGSGGINNNGYKNGGSGVNSSFGTYESYGGAGGIIAPSGSSIGGNGGNGGSINTIYGGGGGGGGTVLEYNGETLGMGGSGGSNSSGSNSGNTGTTNGGNSFYNSIDVPFYASENTNLLLGGGGAGGSYNYSNTNNNSPGNGGIGSGGVMSSIPNFKNPNGSYMSNSYGGGASYYTLYSNTKNVTPVPTSISTSSSGKYFLTYSGIGGPGVVMLWWNNN
uniref:Glycine-rich domain-containing protein n=1 Tax=viral metagenome TaxID=1070528 RepID=A0A6C0AGF1_9ZZZZ